ncbi:hypothetical protein RGC27_08320, partial [Helicobacter pylori]|uniref:hypothetical protein n=1 Tax=Helicobacter pylori TaxID=210 RepID=UPI00292831BB
QGWIPTISPKQVEIFNCYKPFVLVNGPLKSTKTIGCLHRMIRHAWETDGGRILIITKTIKNAIEGGVWTDFTDVCMPE